MVADLVRTGAAVVTAPLLLAARGVQRLASGPRAVLEVHVTRLPDVRQRAQLLESLRRAGRDPHVHGVLLRIDSTPGGWAATGDLRQVLHDLRDAGRTVVALLESPGNGALWLASAAERVVLVPTGEVSLVGVGAELTFFGAALERLGVRPDFEAAGAYKSFGEAYTRTFASAASQEAMELLLGDLHRQLLDGLAKDRNLDVQALQDLAARAPLSAEQALEAGLVDVLAYEDEVDDWLQDRLGKDMRRVPFAAWARRDQLADRLERVADGGRAVAIVSLDGPIVMEGQARGSNIQARKVVPVLRKLRERADVAAVVLHINSPGGSALASDLMWREVDLLQREKPVIAVFEDVAASGGFYLAAPAAEILVRPGTLTGSIGVFGGKLVVGEGLRHLGVHTQTIGASNPYTPSRGFNDAERQRFRASLQRFYDGFVQRVAAGRRQPVEAVEPHCQGRVWTGALALERTLVDGFGSLEDGVERARTLASLPGRVRRLDISLVPRLSVARWLMQQGLPQGARVAGWLARVAGVDLPSLDVVMAHPGEPWALLPWRIELR